MSKYKEDMYINKLVQDKKLKNKFLHQISKCIIELKWNLMASEDIIDMNVYLKAVDSSNVPCLLFKLKDFKVIEVVDGDEIEDSNALDTIRPFVRSFFAQVKDENGNLIFPHYQYHMAEYFDSLKKDALKETETFIFNTTLNA